MLCLRWLDRGQVLTGVDSSGQHVTNPPFSPSCRRAKDCLTENIEVLHKVAAVLVEKENIDGDEFQQIIQESQVRRAASVFVMCAEQPEEEGAPLGGLGFG